MGDQSCNNAINSMMTQLTTYWRNLAAREQRLVLLALTLVVTALLWWLTIAPTLALLKAAPAQHQALDSQLQLMQQQSAQAKALRAQPVMSSDDARQSLQASLKPLGAAAQMTVLPDRVSITFKGVSAESLARWLSTARQNAHAVPTEAHLIRNAALTWDGSLVIQSDTRP